MNNNYEDQPKEPDYCYDPLEEYHPTKEDWDSYYGWQNSCEDKKKVIDIGFGPNITYETYRQFIKNREEINIQTREESYPYSIRNGDETLGSKR